jgi:site-specific DNA-methyltransferase (adenine-specific)
MLVLPPNGQRRSSLEEVENVVRSVAARLTKNMTLIVLGETIDLVAAEQGLKDLLTYQLWVAIKTQTAEPSSDSLPKNHFDALVYTAYQSSLRHSKTRIAYTFCPACELTTKDYGGKKHTYDPYGTLLSDVWRDIPTDLSGDLTEVFLRFADLFSVEGYQTLTILDCRHVNWPRRTIALESAEQATPELPFTSETFTTQSRLLQGDCIQHLRTIPDNSIDFAFADPPYNLAKKYAGYADDLDIQHYFEWCDEWLGELVRVLKPGRTLAVLNIPLWAVRHFHFLNQRMTFQNWIAWDALSYPVRQIMPAHYAILTFSKGPSRTLPGAQGDSRYLQHLIDGYCIRQKCIANRQRQHIQDTEPLTDVWADTHRLKHNSRRVDHPCQLPPKLMSRLIALYTHPGESVLDPFDGSGTTSLTAHDLNRVYIGIELDQTYHELALLRHQELERGLDPFRKEEREHTAKNSPVERVKKQKYAISKKTLQLEVRRVAEILGHMPDRDELMRHGQYPIKYYDDYFVSWGEVTAAARNRGMSEKKQALESAEPIDSGQLTLF